jgi:hypothetical protein
MIYEKELLNLKRNGKFVDSDQLGTTQLINILF